MATVHTYPKATDTAAAIKQIRELLADIAPQVLETDALKFWEPELRAWEAERLDLEGVSVNGAA